MTNIIFDEELRAKNLLENKDDLDLRKPSIDVNILVRYYYNQEKTQEQIVELIDSFMTKNYPFYNDFKWYPTILRYIANAYKQPLVKIENVCITESEIKKIQQREDIREQKVLFTMLCFAKYYNCINPENNGWVNTSDTEVFNLARVSMKRDYRDIMFGQLIKDGYLNFSKKGSNNNLQVCFIDNESVPSILIIDFRELGYQYLRHCGDQSFKVCKKCGALFRPNKNRTEYCSDECSSYQKMETKIIKCIDCDKEFEVDAKDNTTCRCKECYKEYRRKYKAEKERERRKRLSVG